VTQSQRRNPPSPRPHRQGGPAPPPPEPTPAERRAAERTAREALEAELRRERALKKRIVALLETRRAEFRRRRGSPPDVHWNFVEALRAAGAWYGDDDPDWKLPSWMLRGYDPMAHRDYWLSQLGEAPG
jgi:hypothetical protein